MRRPEPCAPLGPERHPPLAGGPVRTFTTCFYFSAATFTTLGYGDIVPAPESRLIVAVEAMTGYVVLGMITPVVFFLLSRWAGPIHSDRLKP